MDLLLEVEQLGWLEQHVDEGNYVRTCLCLVPTSKELISPYRHMQLWAAAADTSSMCRARGCGSTS